MSGHPVTEASVAAAAAVVEVLERCGVEQAVGVPDSQLADVLTALALRMPLSFVMREDVAVAMAVGAELVGRRFAVFMKNAGLGTSLDSLISLGAAAGVPLTLVVGWAGAGRDTLPHHVVMGERTVALLTAAGIGYDVVRREGVDVVRLASRWAACREQRRSYALLVEP